MGTYGKPNKILFIALISGKVDFSERTHRYTVNWCSPFLSGQNF